MNHGRKEAFEPPTYRKLERGFGKTLKDTPRRMFRGRVDNQEITGVKGAGSFKIVFQHGQGS